jgi:ATP-dependent RNA helicase DHX36
MLGLSDPVKGPGGFLDKAVNPPPKRAVDNSLSYLRGLRALDADDGDKLTALGFHLASLPVDPRLGKMLLFGCIFRCIEPVHISHTLLSHTPMYLQVYRAGAHLTYTPLTHPYASSGV